MTNPSQNLPDKASFQAVTKDSYLALAGFLEGKESIQRVQKKEPHAQALREAARLYENREYVAAYECLKPVHDRVVADMQRVLARNVEFEANKLAQNTRKPLAVAKENVLKMRIHAQQVMDQFNHLLQDLESKALVRAYIKKGGKAAIPSTPEVDEPPPTTLNSASETWLESKHDVPDEILIGDRRYVKTPYAPPAVGNIYCVRDKTKGQRIVRVVAASPDGKQVQVEILIDGQPAKAPIELPVDSLARQAAQGWCNLLVPAADEETSAADTPDAKTNLDSNVTMRLDIQNFSRCCSDIVRANIKFDTQRIKDVCDGPFRAGDFEHAFLTFEQLATGFNSAVGSSRRVIADGRRALVAQKNNLSGKEIQERTAAYTRSEHLIHTAEREFSTILEGLRMYLRSSQG